MTTPVSPHADIEQIGPNRYAMRVTAARRFKRGAQDAFEPIVLTPHDGVQGHAFAFTGAEHAFAVDADGWVHFEFNGHIIRKRLRAVGYVDAAGDWSPLVNTVQNAPIRTGLTVRWQDYFPYVSVGYQYRTGGVASILTVEPDARAALWNNLPVGALRVGFLWEYDLSDLGLNVRRGDGAAVNLDDDETPTVVFEAGGRKVVRILGGRVRSSVWTRAAVPHQRRFLFRRQGATVYVVEAFRPRALAELPAGRIILNDTITIDDITQDASAGTICDAGQAVLWADNGGVLDFTRWTPGYCNGGSDPIGLSTYLQFDLSGVSGPITVSYGKVTLHLWGGCGADGVFQIHQVTEAWDDDDLDAEYPPGVGGLVHSTESWAFDNGPEYETNPVETDFVLNEDGESLIAGWVNGTTTNHGFRLAIADDGDTIVENYCWSSESEEVGLTPTLYFEYTAGGGDPPAKPTITQTTNSCSPCTEAWAAGSDYDGDDELGSVDWECRNFTTDVLIDSETDESPDDPPSWTATVPLGTPIYFRCRYTDNNGTSDWSDKPAQAHLTTKNVPEQPTVSVDGYGTNAVALSSTGGDNGCAILHADWEIRKQSDNGLVASSYDDEDHKTAITFTGLPEATALKALHRRANGCGDGPWGQALFTTRETSGQGPRLEFNYAGTIYGILPDIEYGAAP